MPSFIAAEETWSTPQGLAWAQLLLDSYERCTRSVLLPDRDALDLMEQARALRMAPCALEHLDDRFCSLDADKRCLACMTVLLGNAFWTVSCWLGVNAAVLVIPAAEKCATSALGKCTTPEAG